VKILQVAIVQGALGYIIMSLLACLSFHLSVVR